MSDPTAPRTAAAIAFLESVRSAVLDPAIAKMLGADGEVLVALVSPDAIRDALIEAEAAAAPLDVERLAEAIERVTQRAIRMGVKPDAVWHPGYPRMDAITIRNEYARAALAAGSDDE